MEEGRTTRAPVRTAARRRRRCGGGKLEAGAPRRTNDGRTTTADRKRISRPDNRSAMTVEGFAGLREFVRRAVRQLDGAPTDVLAAVESHLRGHHELLLAAWDELRHRGAAVTHVPQAEYDRSFDLVDAVL